ncbi:MAG: hypothetical protein QXX68_01565 [Candidatus Pacearchaeota archaeon]
MEKIRKFYNNNYKLFIFLPLIIFFISLGYIFYFYFQTGDLFFKDVSLTGGTTITLFSEINEKDLSNFLSKEFTDFEIKTITDNTGKKSNIILTVAEKDTNKTISLLESFLGEKLSQENSSIETTSSSLSKNFYNQLISSLILAFFLMSLVVFLIFSKGKKIKFLAVFLTIILAILVRFSFSSSKSSGVFAIFLFLVAAFLMVIYYKFSMPSIAVIFAAASDIILTLFVVNLMEMKISTAGIVAFLMLLGYSVDTNVLLTTRVLKRKKTSVNEEIFKAFKTGMAMTFTSLAAIVFSLIFVYRFQSVLNQIFTVLIIGLCFDIFNTWVFNASLIKWFVEKNENHI